MPNFVKRPKFAELNSAKFSFAKNSSCEKSPQKTRKIIGANLSSTWNDANFQPFSWILEEPELSIIMWELKWVHFAEFIQFHEKDPNSRNYILQKFSKKKFFKVCFFLRIRLVSSFNNSKKTKKWFWVHISTFERSNFFNNRCVGFLPNKQKTKLNQENPWFW